MSIPLVEALQAVDLEAGKTYRCQVKGHWVEVRVLPTVPPELLPAPLDEADIMLDPWVELPRPQGSFRVQSKLGKPPLPDVPFIPADEDDQ
jgi:hypothetical protein